MDEMNARKELRQFDTLILVIDNLSRAIGDLSDPLGDYSLEYIEKKVENAHFLLFKDTASFIILLNNQIIYIFTPFCFKGDIKIKVIQ
ncbi:hypothetical protein ACFVSS_19230 [Peribacillus butanolivorans]|uniref:hypothetical protein n=1 Tax=Peribacillus butanolivorans TaxID=421767 RepID=UPI0036DDA9CF